MSRESLQRRVELEQARLDGKRLERCRIGQETWKDFDGYWFDWVLFKYRIKPEPPQIKLWTAKEALGQMVRCIAYPENEFIICGASLDKCLLNETWITYKELAENYITLTGGHCHN